MSKKNKIVYSDIQPNAKEAGVWVNTTDGNVKVEKDGKWVDDGGSSSESGDSDSNVKFEYYKLKKNETNANFLRNALYMSTYINHNNRIDCAFAYLLHHYVDDHQGVHKIAVTNIPFVSKIDSWEYKIDNGSWKSNFIEYSDGDYDEDFFDSFLEPITEEEFYTIEK